MFDLTTLSLIAGTILLFALIIVYCCMKRFEFVIFLIVISPLISSILLPNDLTGVSEEAVGVGSLLRIIIVGLVGCVGFLQFIKLRKLSEDRLPNQYYFLTIFLLLALISTTYSLDQKYTAIRSINFICFSFFLLGLNYWLYSEENINHTLNVVYLAITLSIIVNALSIIVFTDTAWYFASQNRFRGLMGHPNSMGALCMVSYPVLFWKYLQCKSKHKYLIITLIIGCFSLHFMTGSRTTLLASLFGIVIWLVLLRKIKQLILISATIICLFIILIGYEYSPKSFSRIKSSNLSNLTGRPDIWNASIILAKENPFLGYGFSVGGKIFEDPRFYNEKLELWSGNPRVSLHNGYLSIFIGIGAIGLIIFCTSLILPLWNCFHAPYSTYRAFVMTIILMALLANCFETSIVGGRSIDSVVMWVSWVIAGKIINSEYEANN